MTHLDLEQRLSDRYPIVRPLGQGGMARVYLARDTKHRREVALKVLLPSLADTIAATRFDREIQICAKLTHPNILPLLDSGDVDGLPYYVTPYLPGASLRDRLKSESTLPIADAIRISEEVAEALEYAHEANVLHRDIKPGNILLSSGHAVVADFGIAHAVALAGGDTLTELGVPIGTSTYMSPEQASGELELDGRSDVYSLACVTYEMLTGSPPFTGSTDAAILARHLRDPPAEMRPTRRTIPASVERAVLQALEKEAEDRFESAADFAKALHVPRSLEWTSPLVRWTALAATIVLLIGVTVGVYRNLTDLTLHSEAVVVFPLVDDADPRSGEGIAGLLGYVLDSTEPLRWIEGWHLLDPETRESARLLDLDAARSLAAAAGAAHFITGRIVPTVDSVTVILNLHDTREGAVVERSGASRAVTEPSAAVALAAIPELLLPLLEPGQTADPSLLSDRSPPALVNFYLGEGEYRRGDFDAALDHYFRAVGQDQTFALAALRGAETAIWLKRLPEARAAADLAVQQLDLVPGPYVPLASGIHSLLHGDVDSAIISLTEHLALRPQSTSGMAVVGEAYLHHFPTTANADSLAISYFEGALAVDPAFMPALYHVVELRTLHGDAGGAADLWEASLVRGELGSELQTHIQFLLRCAGEEGGDWPSLLDRMGAPELLAAGYVLSTSPYSDCAEQALRRSLEDGANEDRYYSLQALSGVLVSTGRLGEARAEIDAASQWSDDAQYLHVVLDIATRSRSDAGSAVVAATGAEGSPEERASVLWLSGVWEAMFGVREHVERFRTRLGEVGGDEQLAASLEGYSLAHAGLYEAAVATLSALSVQAPVDELQWRFWRALYPERLLLADLLLQRGNSAEARQVIESLNVLYPRTVASAAFAPSLARVLAELEGAPAG